MEDGKNKKGEKDIQLLGDTMSYEANLLYPEIKVEKKDLKLAKELLASYAGEISEETAVHNYIFQMMLQSNKKIKETLKQIAIVEMHHIAILGQLIFKLGVVPYFLSINHKKIEWFSGHFINYERDWSAVINQDIKEEIEAIQNYEKIILHTKDPNIKAILKRIILDEEIHIQLLKQLKEEK